MSERSFDGLKVWTTLGYLLLGSASFFACLITIFLPFYLRLPATPRRSIQSNRGLTLSALTLFCGIDMLFNNLQQLAHMSFARTFNFFPLAYFLVCHMAWTSHEGLMAYKALVKKQQSQNHGLGFCHILSIYALCFFLCCLFSLLRDVMFGFTKDVYIVIFGYDQNDEYSPSIVLSLALLMMLSTVFMLIMNAFIILLILWSIRSRFKELLPSMHPTSSEPSSPGQVVTLTTLSLVLGLNMSGFLLAQHSSTFINIMGSILLASSGIVFFIQFVLFNRRVKVELLKRFTK